jgi:hypothetical protein
VTNSVGELLEPDDVADAVIEGLREERFLILPHASVEEMVRFKARDREGWLALMRGLRAQAAAI